MDKKEIKEELKKYNEYIFEISEYKIELLEKENKLKEATEPILSGFSSEPNSDIRAKNKISESLFNQAVKNIDIEEYYYKRIDKIKYMIEMYELKIQRIKNMIDLVDKQEKREMLQERFIKGVPVYKISNELNVESKAVYKKIDSCIEEIYNKIKK